MPGETYYFRCGKVGVIVSARVIDYSLGKIEMDCGFHTHCSLGKNEYPCINKLPKRFTRCKLEKWAMSKEKKARELK